MTFPSATLIAQSALSGIFIGSLYGLLGLGLGLTWGCCTSSTSPTSRSRSSPRTCSTSSRASAASSRCIADGAPDAVFATPGLQRAYLGGVPAR